MTTQPEALRLAYALDAYCTPQDVSEQAAAELRRLYKLLMDMQGEIYTLGMSRSMEKKMAELSFNALEKQRDALLEALIRCRDRFFPADQPERDRDELWEPVNAAIKQVEGENT